MSVYYGLGMKKISNNVLFLQFFSYLYVMEGKKKKSFECGIY